MTNLYVPATREDKSLDLPAYGRDGDAGLDLRAAQDATLKPFQRCTIPCGVKIAIPKGYAGFVLPRSGLASNHGISIVNAPGLIDSNYRGEIKVVLINLDSEQVFEIKRGDRIAQLVILAVPKVVLRETDALDETVRGECGFGSSGMNDLQQNG